MRYYGQYNILERTTDCIARVSDASGWRWHQCYRKRGHGPDDEYCAQHARMVERGKHVRVPKDK